jgi:hypothetical protein
MIYAQDIKQGTRFIVNGVPYTADSVERKPGYTDRYVITATTDRGNQTRMTLNAGETVAEATPDWVKSGQDARRTALRNAEQALVQAMDTWKAVALAVDGGVRHSSLIAVRDHIRHDRWLFTVLGGIDIQ